jgi:hypothetical protein
MVQDKLNEQGAWKWIQTHKTVKQNISSPLAIFLRGPLQIYMLLDKANSKNDCILMNVNQLSR